MKSYRIPRRSSINVDVARSPRMWNTGKVWLSNVLTLLKRRYLS